MKLVHNAGGPVTEAVPCEEDAASAHADAHRLRELFDLAEVAILVEDAAGRLRYSNDALATQLGLEDPAELHRAGSMLPFLVDEDRARWVEYGRARRAGREAPGHYRVRMRHADGGIRVLHNVVTPVRWKGGFATQGMLVDVTTEAQATEALSRAEERWRNLLDGSIQGVLVHRDQRLLFVNEAAARIFGFESPEALLAVGDGLELVAAHERARMRAYGEARLRGEPAPQRYAFDAVDARGRPRRLENSVRAVRWDGKAAIQCTMVDITERERARTAEQRLAQALQNITDGFALFDAGERLVICNAAYRGLFPDPVRPRVAPGVRFEALVRACVKHRYFADALGREETWIEERLAAYRRGSGSMEVHRADGGWHRTCDYRLDDGSSIILCSDITALKAREAALQASESRFLDYLSSASDWFWETDAEHRFTYLSPRFTELTGIPASNFIGHFRGEVAPRGADPAIWQRHLEDLHARRPFRSLRYWTEDAGGARRHYETSGVPLFDEAGAFRGYRGTGLDCTAEVEALEAREHYQEAIESLSDGYALFDAGDRLLAWNSAWVAFATPETGAKLEAGMRFEDIVRRNLAHGLFPRAAADPEGWVAERMRLHRECREPFEIRRNTGSWYQVRERRTPDGGTLMTVSEVTELKRREQALRESEERFKDFAETAADWFFETDADLRFTSVSHRFETLTGIAPEALLGERFDDIARRPAQEEAAPRLVLEAMLARESLDNVELEGRVALAESVVHSISARPVFDAEGAFAGYRGSGRDITQARLLSRQLAYQASHDDLTGLVNRREFELRLARAVDAAQGGDARHALCYLDLDQFKVLNDTCGHIAGDDLLRSLGRLLKEQVRTRDTLARLGGDEFALLLEHCSLEQAAGVAESVRAAVEAFEFVWDGKPFRVGASIGLVPIDGGHADASQALRAADNACYLAKDGGRNRVHVYTPQDIGIAHREGEMHWVTRINRALAENRLALLAQPIVATPHAPGGVGGRCHEVLLRLRDDDGTLIPPRAFLPAAERYGLANRIDRWVVDQVLAFLDAHGGRLSPGSRLCVNLSGHSLSDEEFLAWLDSRLRGNARRAKALCFEVTETATIANLHGAREFLGTLRGHGCEVALDDFGTGLSSFAYLRDLPVDYLKIDGAFIRGIEHDPVSLSIVRSINEIGHVLGKRTIAEYVENEDVAALVTALGVDYLQGFGVGMPVALDALLD